MRYQPPHDNKILAGEDPKWSLPSHGGGGGGLAAVHCGKEWWSRKGKEPRTTARPPCSVNHPGHHAGAHATRVNQNEAHATRDHQGTRHAHARPTVWWSAGGGRAVRRLEEWGIWASRTRKRSEAGCGRPEGGGGAWAATTVKRPSKQPAQPRYANYWAPRTRKRHQQEHRPQRPTQRSNPTQHAKGRTGDCPGPRKETATRRNVTQGASCCVVSRAELLCRVTCLMVRVLGWVAKAPPQCFFVAFAPSPACSLGGVCTCVTVSPVSAVPP